MTKTPEELAHYYADRLHERIAHSGVFVEGFVAGYQAAKDEYKVAIDAYNDVAKQMLHEAVRIMTPTHEIAEDVLGACNVPEKPDGWISVKDRLPELVPRCTERSYSNDVLWLTKIGEMVVGNCRKVNELIVVLIPIGEPLITNFTHWMPLPKAPEE
jgi:hypothetical protein